MHFVRFIHKEMILTDTCETSGSDVFLTSSNSCLHAVFFVGFSGDTRSSRLDVSVPCFDMNLLIDSS